MLIKFQKKIEKKLSLHFWEHLGRMLLLISPCFNMILEINSMSDESFNRLFSYFLDFLDEKKFAITQRYLAGTFTIKYFSRKEDSIFSISFVLTSLENLQLKQGIVNNWSPFYLRILSFNNGIVCHEVCTKNLNEIEFYKKLNNLEI